MKLSGSHEIYYYQTDKGKDPFSKWLSKLDSTERAEIDLRLLDVKAGDFGDHKSIGNGVYELRIHGGPGYRIYFGVSGKEIVIILAGGKKKEQKKDIAAAKKRWADYEDRSKK